MVSGKCHCLKGGFKRGKWRGEYFFLCIENECGTAREAGEVRAEGVVEAPADAVARHCRSGDFFRNHDGAPRCRGVGVVCARAKKRRRKGVRGHPEPLECRRRDAIFVGKHFIPKVADAPSRGGAQGCGGPKWWPFARGTRESAPVSFVWVDR